MSKHKYKVGDIVTIVDNNSSHDFPIGTEVKLLTLEFDEPDGNHYKAEALDGSDWWYVNDREIKKVKMARYKVGDKVKILKDESGHKFPIGSVVEITEIDKYNKDSYGSLAQDGFTWWFSHKEIELASRVKNKVKTVKSSKMTKTMQDAAFKTVKQLLVANNTVTTLELKNQLRKDYPLYFWTQSIVSGIVQDFVDNGKLTIVDDNGTYRTYADPTQPARKSTVVVGKSNTASTKATTVTVTAKKVPSTPTAKGKKISRQDAYDLIVNNKGRFFTGVFTKKDGTTRVMNGQYVSGQTPSKLGYVKIKDASLMKKDPTNCIRNMNLQTLEQLKIAGNQYIIK